MNEINQEIKSYIENGILPQYNEIGGHTDRHIKQVIEQSLKFYKQAPELDINMVYVIAAYHDLGRLIDNETHNIESAKLLRKDEFIKNHFTEEEINTMAEAIEDHRASLGREPRSIYGKLVSSADRNTDISETLSRAFDYTKHVNPGISENDALENARDHLRKKYSPDGYAAKTMYFDNPDFDTLLTEIEKVTRTPEDFAEAMRKYYKKQSK